MSNPSFETVAEAQRRAKRRLPSSVYKALVAGSEEGVTADDNVAAFGELGLAPHVAGLRDQRDLTTTVMGQPVSMPVVISPTGVQAVHPDGEVAVARAAAARGTVMGLSCFASKPIEEVVTANPQTFFQTYWVGDKDDVRTPRAGQSRRCGGSHRHVRLVLLERPGLGKPGHPRTDRREDRPAVRPGGPQPAPLVAGIRTDPRPPRPQRPQPGPAGPTRSHLLRRLREVDADTEPRMGRRGLVAPTVGRSVHAERGGPGGRRQAGRGGRSDRHLGLQPRWQQPRRDPGDHTHASGHRRGRGRRGRGAARRGRPTRERRSQSPGSRGAGGHDRAGLPVGPGRQWPGRRGERSRPAPQRDRLGGTRVGALLGPRPLAGRLGDPPRVHPAVGCTRARDDLAARARPPRPGRRPGPARIAPEAPSPYEWGPVRRRKTAPAGSEAVAIRP